jgi:hypothetical protein
LRLCGFAGAFFDKRYRTVFKYLLESTGLLAASKQLFEDLPALHRERSQRQRKKPPGDSELSQSPQPSFRR